MAPQMTSIRLLHTPFPLWFSICRHHSFFSLKKNRFQLPAIVPPCLMGFPRFILEAGFFFPRTPLSCHAMAFFARLWWWDSWMHGFLRTFNQYVCRFPPEFLPPFLQVVRQAYSFHLVYVLSQEWTLKLLWLFSGQYPFLSFFFFFT